MSKNWTLYHYWRSSCSWRLRWALNVKNISFTPIAINLLKGEQKEGDYLTKNPSACVPTLEIEGQSFGESLSIIEYLEETYPEPPLLPPDALSRMKVRQLAYTISSGVQPLQNLATQLRHSDDKIEQRKFANDWINKGFFSYERILENSSGTYSFGSQVSFADLCLIPQVYNALRFFVDMNPYPQIMKIYENCLLTDSCQKAHPDLFKD